MGGETKDESEYMGMSKRRCNYKPDGIICLRPDTIASRSSPLILASSNHSSHLLSARAASSPGAVFLFASLSNVALSVSSLNLLVPNRKVFQSVSHKYQLQLNTKEFTFLSSL